MPRRDSASATEIPPRTPPQVRIGTVPVTKRCLALTNAIGNDRRVKAVFDQAVADMEAAGAVIVPVDFEPLGEMYSAELTVLLYELRTDMDAYLQGLPGKNLPRSLADLVAFNKANADKEMRWFGQSLFEQALGTTDEDAYRKARALSERLAGKEGIDKLLAENDVVALIAPTVGPAWTSDLVNGDHYNGSIGAGSLAAIAGYPHLTVPMGAVEGLPVGLSFMGTKWQDAEILRLGAAYEKARTAALPTPRFRRWTGND